VRGAWEKHPLGIVPARLAGGGLNLLPNAAASVCMSKRSSSIRTSSKTSPERNETHEWHAHAPIRGGIKNLHVIQRPTKVSAEKQGQRGIPRITWTPRCPRRHCSWSRYPPNPSHLGGTSLRLRGWPRWSCRRAGQTAGQGSAQHSTGVGGAGNGAQTIQRQNWKSKALGGEGPCRLTRFSAAMGDSVRETGTANPCISRTRGGALPCVHLPPHLNRGQTEGHYPWCPHSHPPAVLGWWLATCSQRTQWTTRRVVLRRALFLKKTAVFLPKYMFTATRQARKYGEIHKKNTRHKKRGGVLTRWCSSC